MRTTVNLDDDVMDRARKLFGDMKTGELVNRAIRELVRREAARRLAELGGTEPDAAAPPRRRVSFSVAAEDPAAYQASPAK